MTESAKPDRELAEERLDEATSDETLSDLEEKKEISSGTTETGKPPVPSPDGMPEQRRDEYRDSGPK